MKMVLVLVNCSSTKQYKYTHDFFPFVRYVLRNSISHHFSKMD